MQAGVLKGKTLGQYLVREKLGEGGMGVVYVGEHQRLGHQVAIKVVSPALSRDQEVVERFFAEAVAATRVKHSGIIQIFDYGEDEGSGSAYFVMELLEGESLEQRLRSKAPLSAVEIANCGRMIADTLAAAHEAGIVHRDLKPDNVFLVPDRMVAGGERVKVLDFGIAKLTADNLQSGAKTRTGSMLGTPYYMSPEQARGAGKVDWRSDIYSLGCVLFQMACGRVPFRGEGLGEVLGAHQHVAPPPPRSIHPGVDPGLEALILRMLAKSPDERPQSMEEVMAELGRVGGRPGPAQGGADLGSTQPPREPAPAEAKAESGRFARTVARPDSQPGGQVSSPQTTLGRAAGERPAGPDLVPRRRRWLIGGAGAVLAAGAAAAILLGRGGDRPAAHSSQPPAPPPAERADAAAEPERAAAEGPNPWISIEPPSSKRVLGLPAGAPDSAIGFRSALGVTSPEEPYEIQTYEVTWAEITPWLGEREVVEAPWLPEADEERADLPATGVPWSVAGEYCESIGGRLPTEEEWAYAARGEALRRYPWGDEPIDPERTHVYAGASARVEPVTSHSQDRTPEGAYGLLGNAQEWTADLWRPPRPGADDSWVQANGMSFRTIRGLPLGEDPPESFPRYGAAYRLPLCTRGACYEAARQAMVHVGFRCVR